MRPAVNPCTAWAAGGCTAAAATKAAAAPSRVRRPRLMLHASAAAADVPGMAAASLAALFVWGAPVALAAVALAAAAARPALQRRWRCACRAGLHAAAVATHCIVAGCGLVTVAWLW